MPFMGRGSLKYDFLKNENKRLNFLLLRYMYLNSTKYQHSFVFNVNMVVIYKLEDQTYCISKLQIDRDFWRVVYLRHEMQEYKT